ncbi:MAG: sigma-70 family RNA polymerase sigma factor [Rickettsiales bacterium]|nr:sigma-70 family RNA polymerase sigma factor [Pseudomonadota bacterium]MDA0965440.1 sigma-70 family RNA polymerase sigma factor [Pseudomonadota bacterium]MDG4542765.1 sigma-70 family RNA polymerase sigma factor [Rickettsiales bacterium]MDG4544787.1 sigma-70 family RNA polymerase sigma factor [Rickettsiales bacterium]MDG4546909.1 sigma-70 family RNA polymerase sigma factor [Rickettsiales bacterium]
MAENLISLEELMHRSQQGDKQAYASLLGECNRILKGYLMKKISNSEDVEDIIQEILISLHNARHTYDKSRPFKPWLFSIAKFRLYDHFRKIYKKSENESDYLNEISHEFDINVTESDDEYEELYGAIDELPEKQRKIIELMKVEGYTAKEVAKKLNMSESAVKTSAHRIYKTLKQKMTKK